MSKVCRFFPNCGKGTKCPFLHISGAVQPDRKVRAVCKFFPNCRHGDNCRFSHTLSTVPEVLNDEESLYSLDVQEDYEIWCQDPLVTNQMVADEARKAKQHDVVPECYQVDEENDISSDIEEEMEKFMRDYMLANINPDTDRWDD